MPCLFFDARSRETFGPRLHIDLAFYPGQSTLASHPPRATPLTPLRRIATNCPLLFRRNTSTLTPEAYLFPAFGHRLVYSFAFIRFRKNGRGKQRNGNGRFEAAEKGQL